MSKSPPNEPSPSIACMCKKQRALLVTFLLEPITELVAQAVDLEPSIVRAVLQFGLEVLERRLRKPSR
jgi:hypothetical protein